MVRDRPVFRLLLAVLLIGLGGCSVTARSGPSASAILDPAAADAQYDLVELTPATIQPFLGTRRRTEAAGPVEQPPNLALAPGDVLRIGIYERSDGGLFATVATGGSVFQAVRVDESGRISLPYVGQVRVAGLTLARVQSRIMGALAGKALDPEVHVELVANPSHAVLVTGEVRTPGRVTTLEGPLSVVEAIARAGGPTQPAHATDVSIRTDGAVRRMSYQQLLARPSIYLTRGAQVILDANQSRFIAMGAVLKPGLQEMATAQMSLLDGLGQAGGLNDTTASPGNVFLFRLPSDPALRPLVVHIDFSKAEAMFLARRFALQPDDAIYVTNAPVYELQKFITPLVQALILGRTGVSLGN